MISLAHPGPRASPVLRVGHFKQAEVDHFCQAPKQSHEFQSAERHESSTVHADFNANCVRVASWRKGRIDFLERVIQGNLKKISLSMSMFRKWAQGHGSTRIPGHRLRGETLGKLTMRA
jgi:glycyl-tRNA synthetase (class II)